MTGIYAMGLCGYRVSISEDGESVQYRFVGTERDYPVRKARIRYTVRDARPYFLASGHRIYLDECLRTTI